MYVKTALATYFAVTSLSSGLRNMSFGFGVGDFLAVVKLANDLRKQFRDAPDQYKDVSNDVKKLSNVLRVIQDHDPDLSDQQKIELETDSRSCRGILEKLHEIVNKYEPVVSADRNARSNIRRTWAKINWDSKKATDFHDKLLAEINYFNFFLAQNTLQVAREIKSMVALHEDGVRLLIEDGDENKRLNILKWLSSDNPEAKYVNILNRREEGTGRWFLETEEFRKWLHQECHTPQDQRTLFCHGYEGAGKTFISAIVIEELRRLLESDDTVRIAFFFCEFFQQPTVIRILSSLLKQLLQEKTSQLSGLKSLYDALQKKQRCPTVDEILGLLDSAISPLSRVFVVVDALDECRLSGRSKDRFEEVLKKIFSLQKKHNLGLLVTSRSIPVIAELFQDNPRMKIHAHEEDITRCLESGLRGFRAIRKKPNLQSEIISTITDSAKGMFLLAGLQLDSIQEYKYATEKMIRDKLKVLPTSLEKAYRETMERIKSQSEHQTKIARLVLAWIVWATRPLSPLELQHALAAAFEEDSFEEDNLLRIEDIISLCAGMVTVDEQSDIVRLEHKTMYEFLENNWNEFFFLDTHAELATTCISYMLHEALQDGFTTSHSQFEKYLQRCSLFEYSAKNWGYHARMSYSKVKEQVHVFVQSEHALPQSLRVLFADHYFWRIKKGHSITVSPLHPAAYFGLRECLLYFLASNVTLDAKDDEDQTALHWAARNGQVEVAELLLNYGIEVNWAGKNGKTALHYAAEQNNTHLIKILVQYKADMEYTDIDGQTPLLTAVQNVKLEPAQELVSLGASIEAMDSMHRNALHLSAIVGSRSIHMTRFLLERGACFEICDVKNMLPMHYAIRQGSQETAEALIHAGACVNAGIERKRWIRTKEAGPWVNKPSPEKQKLPAAKVVDGLTPLHWAALIGHPAMTKYLLSKGADPNKSCHDGDTPLHLAIREDITRDYGDAWNELQWRIEVVIDIVDDPGSEEADEARRYASEIRSAVIDILLSHSGINVDMQNKQLQTPLHLIACDNRNSIMPFSRLMSKKPDTTIRNYKGQTPLHLASGAGESRMVRDLLTAGALDDALDSEGLTPLQYSVRSDKSSTAVIGLLLDHSDKIRSNICHETDQEGNNLLHNHVQSSACSQESIIMLLNHGGDVNGINTKGDSPLSLYLRTPGLVLNRASICRSLLENGASNLWSDESGRNLAHISMLADPWQPFDKVLLTLKAFDVDITAKDSNNRSILHHGARNGSLSQGIINLLRDSGSLSLGDQDKFGKTPLSYSEEAMLHQDKSLLSGRWESTLNVLLKANGD